MLKRQVTRVRARARFATRASLALLLTASTLWVGAYFWTHTNFGQRTLTSTLVQRFDHALAALAAVGWGPSPLSWWARGLVIGESPDTPVIRADFIHVALSPSSLWSDTMTLQQAQASDFGIHLRWDADGRSNLSKLRRPHDPEAPPPRRKDWRIEEVVLEEGGVTLGWPTWGLSFAGVACRGAISRDQRLGLGFNADLEGEEALFDLPAGTQRFDRHRIKGFVWREGAFDVSSLRLALDEETEIVARGGMGFRDGLKASWAGHARLGVGAGASIWSLWLPAGGALTEFTLSREGASPWRVQLQGLELPELVFKPWSIQGLVGSMELDWRGGGGLPAFGLRSGGVRADALKRGPSLSAQGLSLEQLDLKLGLASAGRLRGLRAESLSAEGEVVEALDLDATFVANIAGGSLEGALRSDSGALTLSGPVASSVVRRRVDADLTWRFEGVRGGLAAWLRRWFPAGTREEAPERLDGEVRTTLGLSASGRLDWSWLAFNWEGAAP